MGHQIFILGREPKDLDTPIVLDLRRNLGVERQLFSFEDHDLDGSDVTYVTPGDLDSVNNIWSNNLYRLDTVLPSTECSIGPRNLI